MWAGIRARLCERDRKESGNWKYQRKLLINYCRTANGGRKLRILYFRSDTVWWVGGVEDGVCRLCIYMEETQFAAPPWSTYAASKWFSHFCVDSLLIQFSFSSSINEMVNQEVGARKCQKFIVNKSCCLSGLSLQISWLKIQLTESQLQAEYTRSTNEEEEHTLKSWGREITTHIWQMAADV